MEDRRYWKMPDPPPEHITVVRSEGWGCWTRQGAAGKTWARGEETRAWNELIVDYGIIMDASDSSLFWRLPSRPASQVRSVLTPSQEEWFRNEPSGKLWVTEDYQQIEWPGLIFTHGLLTLGKVRVRYE